MSSQTIKPDLDHFTTAHSNGLSQLVMTTLVGDLETPVSAFMKLRNAFSGPAFLLESVEGGAVRGRYSMIGLRPDVIWRCAGGQASVNRNALHDTKQFVDETQAPLLSLRALMNESTLPISEDMPPMAAGLFGYLGYDMVREMEHLADAKTDPLNLPDATMIRPTAMVIFDGVKDIISIIVPARYKVGETARQCYETAVDLIEQVTCALELPLPHQRRTDISALAMIDPQSNTSEDEYKSMVARAKNYIRAGDIFQVVLSQRFEAKFDLPAFALYRALRRVNPAPYLCYLDFESFQGPQWQSYDPTHCRNPPTRGNP